MPINKILKVERTEIVVSGKLPEQCARDLFTEATGSSPVVSLRYHYDKATDKTTLRFLPCRIYTVDLPPEIEERFGDGISRERKVVIPGIVMNRNDFIESCWVPARKSAKRNKNGDDLKWVVITPRVVKDDETKTITTELTFFIESYDARSKDPRGCPPENIKVTLDRATELMAEELRKMVSSETGYALEAVHILDELSMEYSEELEAFLTDNETP